MTAVGRRDRNAIRAGAARASGILAGLVVSLWPGGAQAQEPINAFDSATAPSPGHVILKEQFRYYDFRLENGPDRRQGEISDAALLTTLNIGLTRDVSLGFRIPGAYRDRKLDFRDQREYDGGVGDVTALLKWRVVQEDLGALDTIRLSLIGGARIRTGDSPFTSDGYDPIFGLAYTQISGRHGLNAAAAWTFTTNGNNEPIYPGESTADYFRYDLAYLYRLYPETYSESTPGALYGVIELNGAYETNGDHELMISPGLMFEAPTWTIELSVQLPAWSDIDHRAEERYAIIAGVRFSL